MGNETNARVMNSQGWIAILALAGIVLHLVLRFGGGATYADYPLFAVLLLGGIPLIWELLKKIAVFDFGADILAGIAIATSALIGEYLAGALVVFMLSGGQSIENYAVRTASKVLEALAKRAPTIAHRKTDGQLCDIPVSMIGIGDTVEIFPHEVCPVDGVVIAGHCVMDEAYLTGEPFMISKAPGSAVLSGAINGDATLTIKASKLAEDSRYAKIMQVMRETEQKRPRMRRLADELGAWYTPLALAIAGAAWAFSGEAWRFLAVLVIATPCPLLLAIPVAIIGSISLCASRAILIRNPAVLEQLTTCQTMIFDKTGTLTYGKPQLAEFLTFGGIGRREALSLAASVERYSKHPLASAILDAAKEEGAACAEATEINEPPGQGLRGIVGGKEVRITSRKHLMACGISGEALPQRGGGLECVILIDGVLAGYMRFHDTPRADSRSFIRHLSPMHGFKKTLIVSGDRLEEVSYLANYVGIGEVYASQSPEEKVEIVARETKKARTAYLGDGINDAPALLAATVGIAFGQNSDITAEAAGAVVMENTLERVDEFLHISKRMRRIALQSAVGGMALSFVGMVVAAFGFLPPVAGALAQEAIDVVAILNSLRTIRRPRMLTDMSTPEEVKREK